MGRKTAPPRRSPCAPVGSLAIYRTVPGVCRCGEILHMQRVAPTVNDWREVDDRGRSHIDLAPKLLREDPKRWWSELFKHSPQQYSTLKCAVDLGHHSWFHIHRSDRRAEGPTPLPPFCHEQPMWASPDGWQCRAAGSLFHYLGSNR